jgi:hypothetical protein
VKVFFQNSRQSAAPIRCSVVPVIDWCLVKRVTSLASRWKTRNTHNGTAGWQRMRSVNALLDWSDHGRVGRGRQQHVRPRSRSAFHRDSEFTLTPYPEDPQAWDRQVEKLRVRQLKEALRDAPERDSEYNNRIDAPRLSTNLIQHSVHALPHPRAELDPDPE